MVVAFFSGLTNVDVNVVVKSIGVDVGSVVVVVVVVVSFVISEDEDGVCVELKIVVVKSIGVDVGSVGVVVVNGNGDSDNGGGDSDVVVVVVVVVVVSCCDVNDDVVGGADVVDVCGVDVGMSVGSDNIGVGVNGISVSDGDSDSVVVVASAVDGTVVVVVFGADNNGVVFGVSVVVSRVDFEGDSNVFAGEVDIEVDVGADVEVVWLFVSFSTFVVLFSFLLIWIEACS